MIPGNTAVPCCTGLDAGSVCRGAPRRRANGLCVPVLMLLAPAWVAACTCQVSLNACHETAASSAVFIGTVESIEPGFLNQWNPSQRADLLRLNEEYARARRDPSAAALARLKDTYLRTFPDLPDDRKRKLESARSAQDLGRLFYGVLRDGKQIRFHVKSWFKQEEESTESTLEVWTPFGDCGYDFQIGETYLVYADEDEETAVLSTGVCTRTTRLSDTGDDLAYLFFLKNDPANSSRLEGFTTTNELYQTDYDKLHDPEKVKRPVAGVMIALESASGRRFVKSSDSGRFVFDGLAAGDYKLTVFPGEYPREVQLLAGPKAVHVEARSCTTQIMLLPR